MPSLEQLRRALRPLAVRIANSIARATVQLADDSKKLQLLQLGVLAGETIDKAEHFQSYGFSSVPLAGAEAVVIFPNGDRSHPLVVGVSDRRYRIVGSQPGEVTVYNNTGASMTMTKDGDIVVTPAPGRSIKLGDAAASAGAALLSELSSLKSLFATWTPVAGDGGASLKTVIVGWSLAGTTKVKVE
jgi:phage baseplate assembly protein V